MVAALLECGLGIGELAAYVSLHGSVTWTLGGGLASKIGGGVRRDLGV